MDIDPEDFKELKIDVAIIKTDQALIKQEVHYLRESFKNAQSVQRWVGVIFFGALLTALANFVIAGGLSL